MNPIANVGNKFRCNFGNTKNLGQHGIISAKYQIGGTDWQILIAAHTYDVKWLAVFLYHSSDNMKEKNMICEIGVKYRLLNQNGNGKDLVKSTRTCMKHDQKNWGFQKFIEWDKLIDYSNDNSIVIEVEFDFKYYDFSKSIPNFTDITIHVEETDFHTNKWVLCSKSDYFYDLFVNKKNEDTVIKLDDIKAIELCYILASLSSTFNGVSLRSYEDLIKIANKFGVSSLHKDCEQYLIDETDIELIEKIKCFEENGYEKLMKFCIESLKTGDDIKKLHSNFRFSMLKETTKLRIMQRFLDIY